MISVHKRRGRKTDKTGRNSAHQYWNLPFSMAQSPAVRLLNGHALKILVELRARYNGYNNAKIILSYEDACRTLAMSKATVKRAFDELQEIGFIRLIKKGRWHGRMASEWCITFEKCEPVPATHEWKEWQAPSRPSPPKKIKPRYPNGIPACFDGSATVLSGK